MLQTNADNTETCVLYVSSVLVTAVQCKWMKNTLAFMVSQYSEAAWRKCIVEKKHYGSHHMQAVGDY